MDAEKLIAALERHDGIVVSSTELDGVVVLLIRHTAILWRGKRVTVDHGMPFWSGAGRIRAGADEDEDDPEIIARVINNVVAPVPLGFRTSGGSAYL